MSNDPTRTVSRRSVLCTGVIATGALAVGGMASGRPRRRPGGMGGSAFVTRTTFTFVRDWEAFVFEDDGTGGPVEGKWDLRQPPGCTNGRPKSYRSYWIRHTDDVNDRDRDARRRVAFLNPNRKVNVGVPVSIRSRSGPCEGVVINTEPAENRANDATTYKFSFGPA